ncbi:MAG: cupredoxin domain-containing protein [Caulobacteraceae bacterium]
MRTVVASLLAFLLPALAQAADLVVTVRTPQGRPVADAVVSLPAPRGRPIRFPWPYRMAQRNMQFDPFVLIVPTGADVAFPNLDKVRHHVYSFSPAHPFELKLYGHDQTRFVRFDKPGVIAVGCNIHDSMVGFIDVVDTPYAAKTDASGQAVIHEAPAGTATLRVWRPYLKGAQNTLTTAVTVPRQGTARAVVTAGINPPPDPHRMY